MDHVVLVLTCFILTCSNCISAWFTVLTQNSPDVVAVGDVAVITCRTSVIRELVEVRWFRTHGDRRSLINLFQDGRDQKTCDLPEYVGRTELVRDGLANGNATLKLFNVSVTDEGEYRCFLETEDYFEIGDLKLRVAALGSDPRIDIEGLQDGGIKAVCRSAGWYPEPTLVNKDNDGEMKIQQEERGLFSIKYSRVLTENSSRTFSCLIQTLDPHQERGSSSLYVTDDLFLRSAVCRAPTINNPMVTIISIIVLVAVASLVTCCLRRKKQGPSSAVNAEALPLNVVYGPSIAEVPPLMTLFEQSVSRLPLCISLNQWRTNAPAGHCR